MNLNIKNTVHSTVHTTKQVYLCTSRHSSTHHIITNVQHPLK